MAGSRTAHGVATGMAEGLDWKGRPNCPPGFHWDEGKWTNNNGMLALVADVPAPVDGWDVPPIDADAVPLNARAVAMLHEVEAAAVNALTPEQDAACEALALALMQVQSTGLDVPTATKRAVQLQEAAVARMQSLGAVDRAFIALAVNRGNAKE